METKLIETPESNHAKHGHQQVQNVSLKVTTLPVAVNAHRTSKGGIETNDQDGVNTINAKSTILTRPKVMQLFLSTPALPCVITN